MAMTRVLRIRLLSHFDIFSSSIQFFKQDAHHLHLPCSFLVQTLDHAIQRFYNQAPWHFSSSSWLLLPLLPLPAQTTAAESTTLHLSTTASMATSSVPASTVCRLFSCGNACYFAGQYDCIDGELQTRNATNDNMIEYCGSQPYYVGDYYCFDNEMDPFLCPTGNGVTFVRCGGSCYSPTQYSCVNGNLSSTPEIPNSCYYEYRKLDLIVTQLPAIGH